MAITKEQIMQDIASVGYDAEDVWDAMVEGNKAYHVYHKTGQEDDVESTMNGDTQSTKEFVHGILVWNIPITSHPEKDFYFWNGLWMKLHHVAKENDDNS